MKREICVVRGREHFFFAKSIRAAAAAINFSSPVKNEICSLAHVQKRPFDICIIFFAFSVYLSSLSRGRQAGALLSSSRAYMGLLLLRAHGGAQIATTQLQSHFSMHALSHRERIKKFVSRKRNINQKRRRRKNMNYPQVVAPTGKK